MSRLLRLTVVAALLVALGCSGDGLRRVSVKGQVTAKGTPVGNATVSFMPADGTKGEGGIGSTDASGMYTLIGSRRGDVGVVPGKYSVRISRFIDRDGTVLSSDAKQVDYPHAIESVPAPYSSANSNFFVTVPESGGTLDIPIPVKLIGTK
jgi:hypothetical protein